MDCAHCTLGDWSLSNIVVVRADVNVCLTYVVGFVQGDKEKALGLSVSPLMDRAQKGGITRSQVPFPLHVTILKTSSL